LTILAVVGLVAFVIRELNTEHPVVDLRIFRYRSYAAGVFLMTVLGFVLYGSTVLVPLLLQTVLGYPATQAGVAMLPRGLGSFLAMPLVGILMGKIEPRKLLITGILVSSVAFWRLSHLSFDVGYWDFFWPLIIQGMAMGLLFVPLTTITNDPIPKEEIGNATSMFNLMRNLGASFGISTMLTIIARHEQSHMSPLGEHITPGSLLSQGMFQGMRASLMERGMDAVTATKQSYAMMFGIVQRQAAIMSFNDAFFILMILFLLMIPLVFLMQKPKKGAAPGAGMY